MEYRVCANCEELKPLDRFKHRIRNSYSYYEGKCKDCLNAGKRAEYHRDIEKSRAIGRRRWKKRYYEDIDKSREAGRDRAKGKYSPEVAKVIREKYADRIRKTMQKWRKNNLKKAKAIQARQWEQLTDAYVISNMIRYYPDLEKADIENNKDLIELERQRIILYRAINGTEKE